MESIDQAAFDPAAHTGWMAEAACRDRDPSFFFPSTGDGVLRAQVVCARCPVKAECLDYALTNEIHHGVWGGMSERARRRLRLQRRATQDGAGVRARLDSLLR